MTHTQCELRRGNFTQVAWIPSEYATVGKYLKLKYNGTWNDGWKVEQLGSFQDSDFTRERSQDYKNMRKMTDI
jgi:hypothetical protein